MLRPLSMTNAPQPPRIERALGDWARARLPYTMAEFVMFVLKQGWACLFGGLLLAAILISKALWQPDWPIHRYDALFVFAIAAQAACLWFKLETWEEARVILLFHATGTAMEWWMPLPLAALLSSFALWTAENIGTATGT